MRLLRLVPCQDHERDLARCEHLPPLFPRDEFATGRDYAGHADEVAVLYTCIPQRQFEGLQALLVPSDTVC